MRRVAIIGSGGAGKSRLARQLGEATRLPVIHLDSLFWRPGWTETPKDVWRRTVEDLVKGDEWILDGNFGGTMEIRLAAADTIIFLDFPRVLCTYRAIKRAITYWNRTRPIWDRVAKRSWASSFFSGCGNSRDEGAHYRRAAFETRQECDDDST